MLEPGSLPQQGNSYYGADIVPTGSERQNGIDLANVVAFVRRQWMVIASVVGLSLVFAIGYLFVTPPKYIGKTLLMLDTRRVQVFQQQSVMGELTFDDSAVGSQVEILRSVNVAQAVIRDLKLDTDPEFVSSSQSFFGSIAAAFRSALSSPFSQDVGTSREADLQKAVAHLQNNLTVQRVGRTYVLEVGFRSLNPSKAAYIANSIADGYITDQMQAKFTATRRASTWLQERIGELREEAINSDRAVQDFKVRNDLVDTNGRTVGEQQLAEINSQLVTARAASAEAKARLDRISEINNAGANVATVTDALRNDVIGRLRQQWVEASKREAEFSLKYGKDHQAVINLRKDMEQIQRLTSEELRRIAETYRSDYEIAQSRERSLQTQLDTLMTKAISSKQAQVALRVLESSSHSYRTLYDNFLSRFVEATQQQSFPNTEARVITPASFADKSDPKNSLVLAFGLGAGLLLGLGAAVARELLDAAFRTPVQLERTLGMTCLGVLPDVDPKSVTKKISGMLDNVPPASVTERSIMTDAGLGRYVIAEPFSRFAETLRGVKVSADTHAPSGQVRVIGVVSALPAEGKSTVSANLAELMAQTGSRALLIDGDLRNPSLTRLISPGAKRGILEILGGTATLDEVVWRDPLTELSFLPAVLQAPIAHTSGIISSQSMENLLTLARERYDYVVIDLPPMAPVVDARAAAHLIDGFVLVVHWGKTVPAVVSEALGTSEVVRERMIGAVLNRANSKVLKRLEAYKGANYHAYYNRYGSN